MMACRCSVIRPKLAASFIVSRTYVARHQKPPLRWWMDFSREKFGQKEYDKYCEKEKKRVTQLQQRVEKFRAGRGYSDDVDAIQEVRDEYLESKPQVRPSNWVPPPAELPKDLGYIVKRSHLGNLPVYLKYRATRSVSYIKIQRIDGDLWALKEAFETEMGLDMVQVNELTGSLIIIPPYETRADTKKSVEDFLYRKGF